MKQPKLSSGFSLIVVILVFGAHWGSASPWQKECRQVVFVETAEWSSTEGSLRRFQKVRENWVETGKPIPVNVGKNGLGWGRGLHQAREGIPQKTEGDRRAPAGIFLLGGGFGAKEMNLSRFSYATVEDRDLWIDDPNSKSYNRWIRVGDPGVVQDWKSAEILKRKDGLYDHAIVVEHNMSPIVPGKGSAIFMHIWMGWGVPTIGCTTMEKGKIRSLLKWLNASAKPVLIQIPKAELEKLELQEGLKAALQ